MSPYTLAGAVRDLFGLKLGDFPKLKDQLNSLVRNGLIHVDAERISVLLLKSGNYLSSR